MEVKPFFVVDPRETYVPLPSAALHSSGSCIRSGVRQERSLVRDVPAYAFLGLHRRLVPQ